MLFVKKRKFNTSIKINILVSDVLLSFSPQINSPKVRTEK